MATPTPIPFWTKSGEAAAKSVTSERVVNWYLDKNPSAQPKFPYALFPTPGLRLLTTVGDGPCRGLARIQDILYMVSGSKLYTIDSSHAVTEIGDVGGTGDVRMDAGEEAVLIATSGPFYAADPTGVVELPETNIVGVAYQEGYGVAAKAGWQQFNISDGVDASLRTWDPADYSYADVMNDTMMGCASLHKMLWFFKQRTTELFYNSGAALFPFERNPSGFLQVGCLAPMSIAVAANTLFWIGHDHQVYMANGFQPSLISPPEISALIEEQPSPQSARAFVYSLRGHTTYCVSFTSLTLCYDLTTGFWHYRKSLGMERWRASSHQYVWGRNVVGDCLNNKLYELDPEYYSDDGDEIRREADSPPIAQGGSRLQMHELFIDVDAGVGLEGAGQGSDPELMVSWSDDFGHTWGSEVIGKLGQQGEYGRQVRLNRLGAFRQRSMRIACSDPVPVVITGAFARMEALDP